MSEEQVIHVSNGKYTFVKKGEDYRIHCFRYGEEWMIFSQGHHAINGLMDEYIELQSENERLKEALKKIQNPEGIYNRDELVFAKNTIKSMIEIAGEALKETNE